METGPSWRDFDPVLDEYQPPSVWTPDHVLHRMVEAAGYGLRVKGGAGPKGYGSGMPAYTHDWEDVLAQVSNMVLDDGSLETDKDRDKRLHADAEAESRRLKIPPSREELALMEEAFSWPARYLKGRYQVGTTAREVLIVKWATRTARRGNTEGPVVIHKVFEEALLIAAGLKHEKVSVR